MKKLSDVNLYCDINKVSGASILGYAIGKMIGEKLNNKVPYKPKKDGEHELRTSNL